DTVDNIPGVHKCGPKTAVKWLATYDSLDGVIAHADQITGKVGDYLREALPHLPLSYDLATIRTALALPNAGDLLATAPDLEALSASFEAYELRAWREALGGAANAEAEALPEAVPTDYDLVLTQEQLNIWLDRLAAVERFAFDTETTGLNYMDAEIVGVSICTTPGQAAYIPFGHDYPEAPQQLEQSDVLDQLSVFLNDPKKLVIGQNLKFDLSILARYGRTINAPIADTMLESYVYNSVATRHNMDDLAQKYLGRKTVKFDEIAGKGVKQRTFNQIELEAAGHYAAEDADITFQLHEALWPKISGDNRLLPVYQNLEVPLIRVLSQIERNGVLIDCKMLETQSEEITRELADLTVTAFDLAGETFNLSSPKQLQAILFE
ncbi:MAG: DNA polymerase I, partial [Porticoccaceae bacterium]|nr:DNA polymerase I [Porticoccaceae bacterium]